jgi:hypothetical protein
MDFDPVKARFLESKDAGLKTIATIFDPGRMR